MTSRPHATYRLSLPNPERHLCEVELTLHDTADLGDSLSVCMAAWCPGSYLIRDYARFLRDVSARDGSGEALAVRKSDKQTFVVEHGGAAEVVITYAVYGHDLTVRTNHIDGTHAFLHAPATYLYLWERRDQAVRVEIDLPSGRDWTVATGLTRKDVGYSAADLDELLDCPIHAGESERHEFEAAGAPFELVVWGRADGDTERGPATLARDLVPIVEAHAERFGGVPFDRYTFILMLSPRAYGGLEHKNSSANLNHPFAFATDKAYQDLLELLSHEFFHVWNGKRIYPEGLWPFDYRRENYTRCLWVMEGLTSYYDRYTTMRAGAMPAKRYLERICEEWATLLGIPGRARHSIADASFDAWVKLYKAHESNRNTTVSYYLKGGLVSLCLDLEIMNKSGGERRLADVLSALWERYGRAGEPYPESPRAVFEEATALDLTDYFARFIDGTEDPDIARLLATVGLEMTAKVGGDRPSRPWLGAGLADGPLRVGTVLEDGPAERAGLSPGDELIAIDGFRVKSDAAVRKRLAARSAGACELAVFRRGQLLSVTALLSQSPPNCYEIATMDEPSDDQRRGFEAWLGAPWPEDGLKASATTKRWT